MNRERLTSGLEMMGVAFDQTAIERFEAFHAILDEYNQKMDLTAVLDEDERIDRHDLDSAAPLAKGLPLHQAVETAKSYISGALAAMLDLGKGAGPMNHAFALQGEFSKEAE